MFKTVLLSLVYCALLTHAEVKKLTYDPPTYPDITCEDAKAKPLFDTFTAADQDCHNKRVTTTNTKLLMDYEMMDAYCNAVTCTCQKNTVVGFNLTNPRENRTICEKKSMLPSIPMKQYLLCELRSTSACKWPYQNQHNYKFDCKAKIAEQIGNITVLNMLTVICLQQLCGQPLVTQNDAVDDCRLYERMSKINSGIGKPYLLLSVTGYETTFMPFYSVLAFQDDVARELKTTSSEVLAFLIKPDVMFLGFADKTDGTPERDVKKVGESMPSALWTRNGITSVSYVDSYDTSNCAAVITAPPLWTMPTTLPPAGPSTPGGGGSPGTTPTPAAGGSTGNTPPSTTTKPTTPGGTPPTSTTASSTDEEQPEGSTAMVYVGIALGVMILLVTVGAVVYTRRLEMAEAALEGAVDPSVKGGPEEPLVDTELKSMGSPSGASGGGGNTALFDDPVPSKSNTNGSVPKNGALNGQTAGKKSNPDVEL